MSSPRYGFSTPYRLSIRNSARLFNIVLFNMGNLHWVLPALNLGGAQEILVSAQGPLVLGLRAWGQGLTIASKIQEIKLELLGPIY